jgi:hypothetical protein
MCISASKTINDVVEQNVITRRVINVIENHPDNNVFLFIEGCRIIDINM